MADDGQDPWENAAPSPTPADASDPWEHGSGNTTTPADQYYGNVSFGPFSVPLGRYLKMGGEHALAGMENTLGLPGNLEEFLQGKFPDQMKSVYQALGADSADKTIFPTSADITGSIPLPTNSPDVTPQNLPERAFAGGMTGAGAALPLAPFAGPGVIGQGAVGGISAELAGEATGGNPYAETAAGMLGGVFNPSTALKLMTGKGGEAMLDNASSELAAAKAARPDDIAALQAQAAKKAQVVAQGVGSAGNFHSAGEAIQQGARDWLSGVPQREADAWAPVASAMPEGANASVTPLQEQLSSMRDAGGAQAQAASKMTSLMPKGLRQGLADAELGTDGASPTASWQDWQQFHTNIQDALRKPGSEAGLLGSSLGNVHATVLGQMGEMADRAGVFPQFAAAVQHSSQATDTATNIIPKLISGPTPSAADADPALLAHNVAQSLQKSPQLLQQIDSISPEAGQELRSSIIAPQEHPIFAGRSGVLGWGKLSDESKEALLAPDDRAAMESALQAHDAAAGIVGDNIGKLQQTVNGLKQNTGKETNELLRTGIFEGLAHPVAQALGLGSNLATGIGVARASLPWLKRIGGQVRQDPGAALGGGLGGAAVAGGGQE